MAEGKIADGKEPQIGDIRSAKDLGFKDAARQDWHEWDIH